MDGPDVGGYRRDRYGVAVDGLARIRQDRTGGGDPDQLARIGRGIDGRQAEGVRTDEAGCRDIPGRQGRRRIAIVGL